VLDKVGGETSLDSQNGTTYICTRLIEFTESTLSLLASIAMYTLQSIQSRSGFMFRASIPLTAR